MGHLGPARDQLLLRLRSRLQQFLAGQGTDVILQPGALTDAALLIADGAGGPVDIDAIGVVAWLHLARGQALPSGAAGHDLVTGIALFGLLNRLAPGAVPDEIRAELDELTEEDLPDVPPEVLYAPQVNQFAVTLGDRDLLDAVITVSRSAAADHAIMLSNLGNLLRIRFERAGDRADLDEALDVLEEADTLVGEDGPDRRVVLLNLGAVWTTRYGLTGDLAELGKAIDLGRAGLRLSPGDDPHRGTHQSNLGLALQRRFQRTGDQASLDEAVTLLRGAVAATPDTNPDRCMYLCNLAIALHLLFGRTGRVEPLTEAVETARAALATITVDHPDRGLYLATLGAVLRSRFGRLARPADLNEAIELGRAAVAATAPEHAHYGERMHDLCVNLYTRFERTGNLDDLDTAIGVARTVAADTPADYPDRANRLANLGLALTTRFEHVGDLEDLTESVAALRAAVAADPPGHPDHGARLANLSIALRTRFGRTGEPADLNEAADVARAAVDATPADHPMRAQRLNTFALAVKSRFDRTGTPTDLSEAIDALRTAVDLVAPDDPAYVIPLANLGNALQTRFTRTGSMADLDEAVPLLRTAAAALADDHPARAGRLSDLGLALTEQFERTGGQAALAEAVEVLRAAVAGTPEDHPRRPQYLANLGLALTQRFERSGVMGELGEAIDVLRLAVDTTPADDPSRVVSMDSLGGGLIARYERVGALPDLEESIEVGRAALDRTPRDDPRHAGRLSNLGNRLVTRYWQSRNPDDLSQGIEMLRAAVAAIPEGDPGRKSALTNLATTLLARFDQTAVAGDLTDVDESIEVGRAAVAATPPDQPQYALVLSNLGLALRTRFTAAGTLADLDDSIDVLHDAIDKTAEDHPDRSIRMFNLGESFKNRFDHAGAAADLAQAVRYVRAVASDPLASRRLRAVSAARWGLWEAQREEWASALDGFTAAVELLPQVAWQGVDRGSREHRLRELQGIASAAAACAMSAGKPARAVELLEAGRSVIWAQTLQTRDDFALLREADPRLYDSLKAVAARLDAADVDSDRRVQLAGDWDRLLGQARDLPGLTYFLRPPPSHTLQRGLPESPVVVVNLSLYRCDALVVSRTSVTAVPLPAVSIMDAAERAGAYLDALAVLGAREHGPGRADAEQTVYATLEWLWDAVAAPVLDHLGHDAPVQEGPLPRVWWCPTGLLTVLPLHAAGYHDSDDGQAGQTVLDRVVSSYTPTLDALIRAHRQAAAEPSGDGQLLIVAMPHTPATDGRGALPDLPGVLAETRAIEESLRQHGSPAPTVRVGDQATRAATLADLPDHPYVHFSCHGGQDLTRPSDGALYLHDGPLTVVDIAALRLTHAEFAFLSACQTAIGGIELLDESIHLAAALQLAGYRHVIGTLWTVADQPSAYMAREVYARLVPSSAAARPDLSGTASALHAAVRRLRQAYPRNPMIWAPYLHIGP